jgi:glycosyltransferase involved in cell wall biosynthesis
MRQRAGASSTDATTMAAVPVVGTERVSVVIPAKNESENLSWLLPRLPSYIHEVVLVDGHSTDGTVEIARRLRPDIKIVTDGGRGKGDALRTGFAAATGDYIVMIDADGSMDPAEIDRYVAGLTDGCDLVKGSRFKSGGGTTDMTPIRRAGNRALLGTVNLLYGQAFTDLCYGFCAFRREALLRLGLKTEGFEIETEIVVRSVKAGLRIREVPTWEAERRSGQSNLNAWRDGKRVLKTLLRERFTVDSRPPANDAALVLESAVPSPAMPMVTLVDAAELA